MATKIQKEYGKKATKAACAYLERMGYEFSEKNYKCAHGTSDLVMFDGDGSLVFVLVSVTRSSSRGVAENVYSPKKVVDMERVAMCYLAEHDLVDIPVRFDQVSVAIVGEGRALIKHYVNAVCAV